MAIFIAGAIGIDSKEAAVGKVLPFASIPEAWQILREVLLLKR